MIKGKSKEEIDVIEKSIMDKCNQVMNKDYNDYYQEKMKEFPMLINSKLGKKSKDKDNKNKIKNNKDINDNNTINILENDEFNDIKKTPVKIKKKIFENIKVNKNNRSPKMKSKNKFSEREEESKEKKHKNNKKQNSEKKNNKYFLINDDKELKILKSGEKILQKDKNILIKEAENKYKERQILRKDEKKSNKLLKNLLKQMEEKEDSEKSLGNIPTYINKRQKKSKKKLGRPRLINKMKKTKFNVSKLSSHNKEKNKEEMEKESPNINNININQKINFQNTFISNFNTSTKINPNFNTEFFPNNNINIPYPIYPQEKYPPYYIDEEKDFTKINFNKILISDSKDLNKSKKDAPFPFKVPPTVGPFYRSDIKNSSESSGGNNSLGKITPDFRMNPPFIPSNNDKYYFMPQNGPLYFNNNTKGVRYVKGVNNNNNKISTDSNSLHSYSMNQSMLSANSAFKKSSSGSGSGSGSGRSFQPRPGAFNFNNMADLNKEFFSNINLDEKNIK